MPEDPAPEVGFTPVPSVGALGGIDVVRTWYAVIVLPLASVVTMLEVEVTTVPVAVTLLLEVVSVRDLESEEVWDATKSAALVVPPDSTAVLRVVATSVTTRVVLTSVNVLVVLMTTLDVAVVGRGVCVVVEPLPPPPPTPLLPPVMVPQILYSSKTKAAVPVFVITIVCFLLSMIPESKKRSPYEGSP
jgi:hypothetical protein